MKILLTGAAGFLGSHVTGKLLKEGHQVIGLDDLSTGSLENLKPFLDNPKFQFVNADVREPMNFDVEAILNFACPASPVHYQRNPC